MNKLMIILIILISCSFKIFSQISEEETVLIKSLRIGGLLQLWAVQDMTDPYYGTFMMRRMELKVSGEIIHNKINFVAMIDPVSKTVIIDEAGNSTQIVNVVQDLFLNFTFSKFAKFTVGQFKYPITREGLEPTEFLHFAERSRIGRFVGDKRDIGLQFSGSFPFLRYAVAVINGNGQDFRDDNKQKDLASRVVFTPIKGLEFGGSIYYGTATINANDEKKQRFCGEFEYSTEKWGIVGEYAQILNGSQKTKGYYVTLFYRIKPNLEAAIRYEGWDPNTSDNTDNLSIFSAGGGYYLYSNHLKIHLDYTLNKQTGVESTREVVAGVQILF